MGNEAFFPDGAAMPASMNYKKRGEGTNWIAVIVV
jgi:hypothetical protein